MYYTYLYTCKRVEFYHRLKNDTFPLDCTRRHTRNGSVAALLLCIIYIYIKAYKVDAHNVIFKIHCEGSIIHTKFLCAPTKECVRLWRLFRIYVVLLWRASCYAYRRCRWLNDSTSGLTAVMCLKYAKLAHKVRKARTPQNLIKNLNGVQKILYENLMHALHYRYIPTYLPNLWLWTQKLFSIYITKPVLINSNKVSQASA